MTKFSDWLTNQLMEQNMSPAHLSRLMRKDQGVISRILSGERRPSNETIEAIARALKLPPDQVFRAAGILPQKSEEDEWVEKMDYKLKLIRDPVKRQMAEKLLETLTEEEPVKPTARKIIASSGKA
jgi:transcriptional regulator with XRE-family HTH domain